MKKRFLSILLALSMVLTFLPLNAVTAFAEDVPVSGPCGADLTWTLDSNGTLTISDTGAMEDYDGWDNTPWYHLKSQIKQVILEKGVTYISKNAFSVCPALTHVSISDSVTSIGEWSFCETGLTEIPIPDSVTSIGLSAFRDCDDLTNIVIPGNVTSIGPAAFSWCKNLTSVTLLDGVSSIGRTAFWYSPSLTTVTIPGSVTSIGDDAFSHCPSLTAIQYTGTQEQWETLKPNISSNNGAFWNPGPTFVAPLTVTNGHFTYKQNGQRVTGTDGYTPVGAEITVTFDKAAFADSHLKFSYWDIDGLGDPNAYQGQESFTFTMPANEVKLTAMMQDDSIDDAVAEVLGTTTMVTTAVAGTAVLAYTGYQIGTELYLTYLLPTGAAIPANAAQLAELVWTDAGKPAPAAVLPEDAAEAQQAMAWAVDQELLPADKAPDTSVSRIEVIRTWKKAQSTKQG